MSELYDEPARRVMLDVELALAAADSYIASPGTSPAVYAEHLVRLAGLPQDAHGELTTVLQTRAKLDSRELTGMDRMGVIAASIGRRLLWDQAVRVQPGFLVRERSAEAPVPEAGNGISLAVRCTHYLGVLSLGRQRIVLDDRQPVFEATIISDSGCEAVAEELAYVRYIPSKDRPANASFVYELDGLFPGLPSEPTVADVFQAASRTIREYHIL